MSFSDVELDSLCELLNIGVGRAASVLNEMLNSPVSLGVPNVEVVHMEKIAGACGISPSEPLSAVLLEFGGGFTGATSLVFTTNSATRFVEALTGEIISNEREMDALRSGTLTEVGNIIVNSVMGSIANIAGIHIEYRVPVYMEGTLQELFTTNGEGADIHAVARTTMRVESLEVASDLVLSLELDALAKLLEQVNQGMDESGGLADAA